MKYTELDVSECKYVFGGVGQCLCLPASTIWPWSTTYAQQKANMGECADWCCNVQLNHRWYFTANGDQNTVQGDCSDGWKKRLDSIFGGWFTN